MMEEILEYKALAPVHHDISALLTKISTGKRKGLFLLPRGHLKSTEITISHVIQSIVTNPNIRILITNALLDNSKGFLREIKSHFEKNERLIALFGDMTNTDEKWSESQIIIKNRTKFHKEPTVQITSVDKSVVSQHYDLIIADDLITRENTSTKEQREKLKKYYKDLLDLLEPDGTLLVIGTRWHYDDLYGWLLSENKDKDFMEVMIRRVLTETGAPLFPQKFTPDYIKSLKEQKGSYEFNAQYNNDPVSEEEAEFKREYFKFFKTYDLDQKQGNVYVTIDPAVSKQDTSDYTGIVINLVKDGAWKILEARKMKLNPTELVDEIFHIARKYKENLMKIGIEDIMYTTAIDYDVTRRMQETGEWFTMEKVKHKNRTKTDRIRALVPLFERGNIELSERCTDLEEELTHFPVGEHDDIIDALAYQLYIVKPGENYSPRTTNQEPLIKLPAFPKY